MYLRNILLFVTSIFSYNHSADITDVRGRHSLKNRNEEEEILRIFIKSDKNKSSIILDFNDGKDFLSKNIPENKNASNGIQKEDHNIKDSYDDEDGCNQIFNKLCGSNKCFYQKFKEIGQDKKNTKNFRNNCKELCKSDENCNEIFQNRDNGKGLGTCNQLPMDSKIYEEFKEKKDLENEFDDIARKLCKLSIQISKLSQKLINQPID